RPGRSLLQAGRRARPGGGRRPISPPGSPSACCSSERLLSPERSVRDSPGSVALRPREDYSPLYPHLQGEIAGNLSLRSRHAPAPRNMGDLPRLRACCKSLRPVVLALASPQRGECGEEAPSCGDERQKLIFGRRTAFPTVSRP